jgi:hypothetical protein
MNWQEEFDVAMQAFGTVVEEPIEYRLHYDQGGNIVQCTMQAHPSTTEYIVVDKETYNNYNKYRVNIEKKRLIKIDTNPGVSVQLKRSSQGYATVKGHAGLLLETNENYPNLEYYDRTN